MKKRLLIVTTCLAVAWMAACVGCAANADGGEAVGDPPAVELQPGEVRVFRGSDGTLVEWNEMIAALSEAEAVVIGENHGHPLGLAFAAELWSGVLARRDQAVLSMEFFNRDEQSRVDDYLAGLCDEAAFRKGTGRESDSVYPPGHRAMVEAAKAKGRPVIAANSPRVYVRTARLESFERLGSLTEDQRRMFRVPDELPTGKYRADFDVVMSGGGVEPRGDQREHEASEEERARLDASFRAQSTWDWTMAESVARGIDRQGTPVVHVVGRFHSDFEGGLVLALTKIRPGTRVVIVSVVDARSRSLKDEDRGRADFVAYVGPLGKH
ncbi:MAG: ChaN family lipoprotein [Phycisphaerales bacterium]|nr:ChaN family lipoprotein [Phycisphaerales bacterium]